MRRGILRAVVLMAAFGLMLWPATAGASAPSNDNFASAQVITGPVGSTSGFLADATAQSPCGPAVVPSTTTECEPNHGDPADLASADGGSASGIPTGCWGGHCADWVAPDLTGLSPDDAMNALLASKVSNGGGWPNPAMSSVWFKWVAPLSKPVTFSDNGSDFDTLMSVYKATDPTNLSPAWSDLTLVAGNDQCTNLVGNTQKVSCLRFTPEAGTTYWVAVDQGASLLGETSPAVAETVPTSSAGCSPTRLPALPRFRLPSRPTFAGLWTAPPLRTRRNSRRVR